jgi:hypothetical protein
VLPRAIDALSEASSARMSQLLAAMHGEIGRIQEGGGEKATQRHRSRAKM